MEGPTCVIFFGEGTLGAPRTSHRRPGLPGGAILQRRGRLPFRCGGCPAMNTRAASWIRGCPSCPSSPNLKLMPAPYDWGAKNLSKHESRLPQKCLLEQTHLALCHACSRRRLAVPSSNSTLRRPSRNRHVTLWVAAVGVSRFASPAFASMKPLRYF